MATLYDETGAVVASGITVLHESRLTQRRTDVVHDPVLGGLPYVVQKEPSGLSGNLELLCPSGEIADAVYAAHAVGPLRLDTYTVRENRFANPSFETDGAWIQSGSIASITQSTFMAIQRVFAVVIAANATPSSATSGVALEAGAVAAGQWLAARMSVRPDGTTPSPRFRIGMIFLDDADATISNVISAPFDPTDFVYTDLVHSAQAPAGTASARVALYLADASSFVPLADSWVRTDAWVGAVADTQAHALDGVATYFDGTYAPPGYTSRWTGAPDASSSVLSDRPALDLTYLPVGGCALPVKESPRYWRVSVPGIQEVSA